MYSISLIKIAARNSRKWNKQTKIETRVEARGRRLQPSRIHPFPLHHDSRVPEMFVKLDDRYDRNYRPVCGMGT